jgi:hypothetical protein
MLISFLREVELLPVSVSRTCFHSLCRSCGNKNNTRQAILTPFVGVAAGRLAKANPDLKILLVEGGKNNYNDPTVKSQFRSLFPLSHLLRVISPKLVSEANPSSTLSIFDYSL